MLASQGKTKANASAKQKEAASGSKSEALWKSLRKHPLSSVGPGLITGVADDDPSGIATYAQAGAQFGLNMLWTMPLAFPLMGAMQSMSARIARVTGKGLAANIKTSFPPIVLKLVVFLLLISNTLNIAADIAAMGEAAELVTGLSRTIMTLFFVVVTLALQIGVPYHRYVAYLKWLGLSLLTYAAVAFVVHVPWKEVTLRLVWPKFEPSADAATMIVGVLGTTISPYLFFWQASEELEEMRQQPVSKPLNRDSRRAGPELRRIWWDTWSGMFYSNLIACFIMLATAVTLHASGMTNITTAAQAASALRPVAGHFASVLFALGIIGVGLIGVPVLAGSAGYAMCEAMGWKWGLERKPKDALGFYGVIAASVLAALAIPYSPIAPMKALFWSAVINGVVAVPVTILVVWLATRHAVMGKFTVPRVIAVLGWITAAVMTAAAVRMLIGG